MVDPVAVHLGPLSIRWYGLCVAAGFLAGYQVVQRRARRLGLGPQVAADVTLAAMLGGILGARILYVLQNWESEFSASPWTVFAIWQGGLVFYGGFLGAVVLIVAWSRRQGWPLLSIGDLMAPALPLGHALGRIGCLLNGCCFGRPWSGPLGVTYPGVTRDGLISGPLYVQRLLQVIPIDAEVCRPVFPIQLLEAVGNLGVCLALLRLARQPRWRGQLFPLYLALYAPLRFVLEFGRGDYLERPGGLTSAQWLCLALALLATVWLGWNRSRGMGLKEKTA